MIKAGTVEGFFGKQWAHNDRLAHCDFLKKSGYNFYIYAPKNDPYLRKKWHQDWNYAQWLELQQLSEHCKNIGLEFGVGFSPFELHLSFNKAAKLKLDEKIRQINQLAPDILCILFDDMRGGIANLAEVQVAIVDQIRALSCAKHYVVCPSYYSDDPILDKVFGQRPSNYLEDLGRLLPTGIDIFWTGMKVCSKSFTDKDISLITEKLQRKPFLWDNYPVNDGEKMCNHLHLSNFQKRENLSSKNISGHAINPMNQAWLSRIPLLTLPSLHTSKHKPKTLTRDAITQLCSPEFSARLLLDLDTFQNLGLDKISTNERINLISLYNKLPSTPYTKEVIDWLSGSYSFDPDCLTN